MEIQVTKLHPRAVVPSVVHDGDAGCDLVAVEGLTLRAGGGRGLVATGLAVAIPTGHGGFVLPRSGLASKHGVTCSNAPGLIDAGYRGEVKVSLVNHDPEHDYEVHAGDRVAQLVVLPVVQATYVLCEELPDAARGDGGFGSTGR